MTHRGLKKTNQPIIKHVSTASARCELVQAMMVTDDIRKYVRHFLDKEIIATKFSSNKQATVCNVGSICLTL